jgi:drug/metabolite transporter (DMT)-like permease
MRSATDCGGESAGVTGSLWAVASGVGFGVFQTLNRRALSGIDDAYVSTFLQLVVAAAVLVLASVATQDLDLVSSAPAWALVAFAVAGIVHFLLGWTFLNLSQKRIGAARTAPLLTTTPLFGLLIAAALGEVPNAAALVAILPMVAGAYLLSGGGNESRGPDAVFGLGTALMWAISAVLTVEALDGLPSPLLGVALGLVAAVPAYGAGVVVRRSRQSLGVVARRALAIKVIAATLLALATWSRLLALDDTDVGVVLALNLVSVPVVLLLAPLVMGRHIERVTRRVWAGAALVVTGTLSLIALG